MEHFELFGWFVSSSLNLPFLKECCNRRRDKVRFGSSTYVLCYSYVLYLSWRMSTGRMVYVLALVRRPATTKIFFPDQSHQSVEDTTHSLSLYHAFQIYVAQSVFIVYQCLSHSCLLFLYLKFIKKQIFYCEMCCINWNMYSPMHFKM